jgi:uncharacterized protein YbbC (DUF1343 family)
VGRARPAGLLLGIDRLIRHETNALRKLRVGMVTHDAAVTAGTPRALTPSRLALHQAGITPAVLFSPEHGIGGSAADGAPVADAVDPLTGAPVRSLYGDRFVPDGGALDGLDVLLVDLQDVGVRFYTYIWTMSLALERAAGAGVPVWVLDRPNPLGGALSSAEGPLFDETIDAGMVARWSVPVRHSLTIGELARFWNRTRAIGADLRVIAMEGWERGWRWPRTGLPFVPTSPAMPSYETALLYAGTGLLEGLTVNDGRGTATPFRVAGAPWMDGPEVAGGFNALELAGVAARPVDYTPAAGRHAGRRCSGVMLHVTDDDRLRPVHAGLHLVALLRDLYPQECEWARYPTAANPTGEQHFAMLIGRRDVGPGLAGADGRAARIASWTRIPSWAGDVALSLLYA